MHRPTEFVKRFADRQADRQYTDDELLPRNETSEEVRRVRETAPPYGATETEEAAEE